MRGVSRLVGVNSVAIEMLHGGLLRLLGVALKDNLFSLLGLLLSKFADTF